MEWKFPAPVDIRASPHSSVPLTPSPSWSSPDPQRPKPTFPLPEPRNAPAILWNERPGVPPLNTSWPRPTLAPFSPSVSPSLLTSRTPPEPRRRQPNPSLPEPIDAPAVSWRRQPGAPPDMRLPNLKDLMYKRKSLDLTKQIDVPNNQRGFDGGYGVVHIGTFRGEKVAVKVLKAWKVQEDEYRKKTRDDIHIEQVNERRLRREMNVWTALKHPNICEFLGYTNDFGDYPAMVSPWHRGGSVAGLLYKPSLPIGNRLGLMRDVCNGTHYLHRLFVIHGDLKPTNVLVDDNGRGKICDFGLVKLEQWKGPHGMTTTSPYMGTARYKPRELFPSLEAGWPKPTFQSDIYSLGCIMLELVERITPFKRFSSSQDVGDAIMNQNKPAERTESTHALVDTEMEGRFWDLLEVCWDQTPAERPHVGTIVRYLDWFF